MNPNNSNPEASTPEENPTPSTSKPIRRDEGDACRVPECPGTYELAPVENCSCHISPPCNACVENPLVCNECGDDQESEIETPISEVETAVLPREAADAHRPSERCPRWVCYKEAYYLGGRLISCTDNECANYDKEFMRSVAAVTELVSIDGPGPMNPIPSPIDWSRPVQTKGAGKYPVRIIAIDHTLEKAVIGVMVGSGSSVFSRVSDWHYNGQYDARTPGDCLDLENVPVADALRGGSK